MKPPKSNDFADRQKNAAEAKKALLEKFKASPKLDDPEMVAKRAEKAERAAQKAERLRAAKAEKAAAAEAEAARQKAAKEKLKTSTEAERKAERDRRYAARKARK